MMTPLIKLPTLIGVFVGRFIDIFVGLKTDLQRSVGGGFVGRGFSPTAHGFIRGFIRNFTHIFVGLKTNLQGSVGGGFVGRGFSPTAHGFIGNFTHIFVGLKTNLQKSVGHGFVGCGFVGHGFSPTPRGFRAAALVLMVLFVSSCSTQTKVKTVPQNEKAPVNKVVLDTTAEELLVLAQSLHEKAAFAEQQDKINTLLVKASELFLQQQNFAKALWLADKTSALLPKEHISHYALLLVKAASLQALNYNQAAAHQLQLAHELVLYNNKHNEDALHTLTWRYYSILAEVLTAKGQTVAALSAQLNAFALNNHSSADEVIDIWQKLAPLTQWQIAELVRSKPPFIKGWQTLLQYSQKFGANSEQFSRYISVWQESYPTHPASSIATLLQAGAVVEKRINVDNSSEASVEVSINSSHASSTSNTNIVDADKHIDNAVNHVAVLLPLSGSQQKAGIAAQQGILAAYENNEITKLHFIDSDTVDWDNIATQFSEHNIDHVIGPLLKANVAKFLAASTEQTALQIPTLLLNMPSQPTLASYQAVLSMRPEDEAIQAAATLSQRHYKQAMVLSHQDRVSKRIALAFRQQWQKSTGKEIDIVYFNQGKAMQNNLKESLDIDASQTRIDSLNNRIKNIIKAEPRNRRDIDMIYLVGTAAQTRLIKPYIDVNTSPFADIIPVYASSRSHSYFYDVNNANSAKDLQGLTFTQIPWLLASKQQNKPLSTLSQQLWPKRTDSLSRIFAMGFDSYNLLGKIALMKQAPYIRHFGQTGVLKLNDNNILTRSLVWGKYQHDKVAEIVLD